MNARILPLIALLGFAVTVPAAAEQITPTPRAVLVPAGPTNRPFLGARSALLPVDLAARGYVEEEYFVSGGANVYDWAAPGAKVPVTVRTAHIPYTTRILVRRPQDARKASGRVIVELLNPSGSYDLAPLWGLSWEHFLRRGDIWVGLTIKPVAVAALKRFDPVRYDALSFAFQQSADCKGGAPDSEDGLAWDILAQVGALLRSGTKENPLAAVDVRRIIAAGYSQTGGYLVTYINALHDEQRLGNERPIYDAYLDAAGAMVGVPINQCSPALPVSDPRRQVHPRDVPVLTVMTQTDFAREPSLRRADSDDPQDYFRLYELAGAAHSGPFPAGQPSSTDLTIAGVAGADSAQACAEPQSSFPLGYAFNALWLQLDEYLLHATALAHAEPISLDAQGRPVLDAVGNVVGGLRLPQLEVPLAVYAGSNTPRDATPRSALLCSLTGSMRRLEVAQLKGLYGNRAGYLKRFNAAVDAAVAQRWLEPADATQIKAQALRSAPAF